MGRWFERFFSEAGYAVLISGRKTELTWEALAKKSDVVILSVPGDAVYSVCKTIGPLLKPDQLLMDLCSLKEDVLKIMLDSTSAQVVGAHPLFGPFTNSIKGQNVILCPGKGETWLDLLEDDFKAKGAIVTRMDAVTHDKNMAVVQGLVHFLTVCMGRTLQKTGMAPGEAILCSTPIFRVNLDLVGRLFAQDLDLYAGLIGKNRHVKNVLETFLSSVDETRQNLLSGKDEDRAAFMEMIREFLSDFCESGLAESNKILNSLYL